jgi:hypothetical protein
MWRLAAATQDFECAPVGNPKMTSPAVLRSIFWARTRVGELEQERRRLARGVVTGAIPEDLGREEQSRIATELKQAQRVLATAEMIYERIEDTLERALTLVGPCDLPTQEPRTLAAGDRHPRPGTRRSWRVKQDPVKKLHRAVRRFTRMLRAPKDVGGS